MPCFENDPVGRAIHDYILNQHDENIIVKSSLCEDDVIPVSYLFRGQQGNREAFTILERIALDHCKGKILEIGAGAGIHATYLSKKGFDIQIIETSKGAVEYHRKLGLHSRCLNFYDLKSEKFNTLLFLMNGLGIAKSLVNLPVFLEHCYNLLETNGEIICDSTDIIYLYEDDEGGFWMDLNAAYYGDFDFQMCYKDTCGSNFQWLYVDFDTLNRVAKTIGFSVDLLFEHENQYLARLKKLDK